MTNPIDDIISQAREVLREEPPIPTPPPGSKPIAKNPSSITDKLPQYKQYLLNIEQRLSTGFASLDSVIGGLMPGSVYTITGTTNVGKTTFAANIIIRVLDMLRVRNKSKVLVLALEPRIRILTYLAAIYHGMQFEDDCNEHDVPEKYNSYLALESNIYRMVESDSKWVEEFLEEYSRLDYMDKSYFNNSADAAIELLEKIAGDYSLIVVDHMGYLTNKDDILSSESDIINKLAEIAAIHNVPIINIVHTNKGGIDKTSLTLSDLKGNSSIVQDSTDAIAIERFEDTNEGILSVLKTKYGPNRIVKVKFKHNGAIIEEDSQTTYSKREYEREVKERLEEECMKAVMFEIFRENNEDGNPPAKTTAIRFKLKHKFDTKMIDSVLSRFVYDCADLDVKYTSGSPTINIKPGSATWLEIEKQTNLNINKRRSK